MEASGERNSIGNSNVDPDIYPKKDQHTISTSNLAVESTNDISDVKEKKTSTMDAVQGWLMGFGRFIGLLLLLYIFICSLTFLTDAFRLIAGRYASSIFKNETMTNPIVGLMIGVLFTVLVQSSSTCTTVIVALVASKVVNVETAIPMVMGANIGTSMTSTLVSLTQMAEPEAYERAFSAATVHDCFNWLSVIFMLVIEVTTHYLRDVSGAIINATFVENANTTAEKPPGMLKTITKPLTKKVIQIDKKVLECWGEHATNTTECDDKLQRDRLLKVFCDDDQKEYCGFLFNNPSMSDAAIGGILLVLALVILSGCLLMIVKLLRSILEGSMANVLKKFINADIPYVPWLTGYIAMIVGAIMTFIVQSSSVFSSTLTPMVGVGLITVERVYPLLLGSNIGTTTTAFLAAMAEGKPETLQIALCHLFFNLTGILIFYPIPFMRWPLGICRMLGRTTARYRWFALFYLFFMFFFLPGIVMALSLAGTTVLMGILAPIIIVLVIIIIINILQAQHGEFKCQCASFKGIQVWLPSWLRNWDFLPLWMHSLDPVDKLLRKVGSVCCGCCAERFSFLAVTPETPEVKGESSYEQFDATGPKIQEGNTNPAFEDDEKV